MTAFTRAMDSSLVVRSIRRLAAGSVVCAAAIAITRWPETTRWLRQTRQRIVVGLGGEWSEEEERRTVEQLDALASSSRLVAGLSSVVTAPLPAWRTSGLRRVLWGILSWDLEHKIEVASRAIIVAVLTHTALFWVLGEPVHALGWSTRALLVAAGLMGLRWPELFAAAWKDRQTRSR
jgi:hypothetical protein